MTLCAGALPLSDPSLSDLLKPIDLAPSPCPLCSSCWGKTLFRSERELENACGRTRSCLPRLVPPVAVLSVAKLETTFTALFFPPVARSSKQCSSLENEEQISANEKHLLLICDPDLNILLLKTRPFETLPPTPPSTPPSPSASFQ